MMKVHGGKTIYGAAVGILMLETRFPRIVGDMGNAATWPFPVFYRTVRGATPDLVVRKGAAGLKDAFIETAKSLVEEGVDGITTTCGFLSLFQQDLAAAVGVPVAASSLSQISLVQRFLPPDKRVGVITISRESLTEQHLINAGAPVDVPVVGTESGREFTRVILDDEPDLDVDLARLDLRDAGRELMTKHPDVGAIVLECTNMAPYAADLRAELGVPVYSIYTLVSWFQGGLLPARFSGAMHDSRY
ncbi:aspartate/glutamate racemase family protein [Alphaproteobacteria bacterium HT1-32]|nr:aspartate/glutamate racemase family protein [Alphaproteobacteria bacterium HT1-32]